MTCTIQIFSYQMSCMSFQSFCDKVPIADSDTPADLNWDAGSDYVLRASSFTEEEPAPLLASSLLPVSNSFSVARESLPFTPGIPAPLKAPAAPPPMPATEASPKATRLGRAVKRPRLLNPT